MATGTEQSPKTIVLIPFLAAGLACLAIVPALLGSRHLAVSPSKPGLRATPAAVVPAD